ncbi:MAG: metal ABC transporter substrate-binding protein [Oleiphilus sp.]|nr:MAG: metal ABC transporter substrate-binding protein [Oleiphilus sp.]
MKLLPLTNRIKCASRPGFGLPLAMMVLTSILCLPVTGYAESKLKVITSFSILADWVRVLGGGHIEVLSLVGPDEDVHVYRASPDDLQDLAHADIMIINGMGLEGWLERLIEASGFQGTLVRASAGIEPIYLGLMRPHAHHHHENDDLHGDGHGLHTRMDGRYVDPHAWLSPRAAKRYVDNIARALKRVDPSIQDVIEQNRLAYQQALTALDASIREAVDALPKTRRQVVVPHAAFKYFERDYGITFHSLQGMSTESESSAAAFASIVRTIRAQGIDAVFGENTSSQKLIERVASEANLKLGGKLYSGALSKQQATSYLEMMRFNADQLLAALK